MRVGVLTSSRADFSIYLPLLKEMVDSGFCKPELIVFGTHLSPNHGFTLKQIKKEGFDASFCIGDTFPLSDKPEDISLCIGRVVQLFSSFWAKEKFDLVFALGDRFEMFAACIAGLPFNLKIAHIHGGEKTIGAIDDALRHAITHISTFHFTAAEEYRARVVKLIESEKNVFNVGALSIDNLRTLRLFTMEEFKVEYGIDLKVPTFLITFHPETVTFDRNEKYIHELLRAIEKYPQYQMIITMPNADTMGNLIRKNIDEFIQNKKHPMIFSFDSLGTRGYYSCIKYCKLMLGNTSSGFGEAYYFHKPVVNLGNRQMGRIMTENIFQSDILEKEILLNIEKALKFDTMEDKISIYGNGNASKKIMEILSFSINEL